MKTNKKFFTLLLFVLTLTFAFALTMFKSNNVKALTDDEKTEILSYFSKVGDAEGENGAGAYLDYIQSITYEDFTATNFSGSGVMVKIRNKTAELVSHEENDNSTNPMLLDFPDTKYPVGVKLNKDVYIADNTSKDTLLELSFPGENDNYQACGIKVIIDDATDPSKHIALYVWRAYGNTDSGDGGSIIASAGGSWEKTRADRDFVTIGESGFDYKPGTSDGKFVKVGTDINDGADSTVTPKDGCYLNTQEYGHSKTSVKLSRTSANTIKVQFDYKTAVLSINGVEIRHFKDYSADGEHFFPGFTDGKVRLSVGYQRSTRRSTDEFTRFCIMNVDKHESVIAPFSGLIESGETALPKPINYNLFEGAQPITSTFYADITDPSGNKTENYSASTFNFDKPGEYTVDYYFLKGSSSSEESSESSESAPTKEAIGTAKFTTAYKNAQGNLSEIVSFEATENMFCGKKITLADFKLKLEDFVTIESATVKVYSGATLLATETANAEWAYVLQNKGELTFVVSNDNFTLKTNATVLPGIYPTATPTNGSVVVDEIGEATGSFVGTHTLVITPADGYRLASLLVNDVNVTADVEDGEYEFEVESLDNNVTYTATFEAIPKFTVTYKDGETTVGTVSDVIEGTLFKDVTAPTAPTKAGYTFSGWSLDANSAITADVTATAQFETITYTITYNLDGGTNSTENKATYTVEDAFTLANPTKEGYKFLGWSNEASESVTAVALGTTGNLTFTAHWEAETPVNPVTQPPVTQAPVTQAPATQAPATQAPATQAPATQAPATQAPKTQTEPAQTGKKGCKNALVPSILGVAFLLGSIVVIKRKREE